MVTHIRTLGWLHIALGALGLFGALVVWLIGGSIAGILHFVDPEMGVPGAVAGVVLGAIGFFLAVLSLPSLIAGWGLLNMRRWARVLTLILSAFHLFHVPLGTALAVYSFWVLLKPETDGLFRLGPPIRT
ncbi:MAG: hypothetical protein IT161_15285 [Bryobacterales bacterium]|nr:hypothetical protein [Bryobacterales bacterium]